MPPIMHLIMACNQFQHIERNFVDGRRRHNGVQRVRLLIRSTEYVLQQVVNGGDDYDNKSSAAVLMKGDWRGFSSRRSITLAISQDKAAHVTELTVNR
jgi:hypothetical protein